MSLSHFQPIKPRSMLDWRDRTLFGSTTDISDRGQSVASLAWPEWFSGDAIGGTSIGEWRFSIGVSGWQRIFGQQSVSTFDYATIKLDYWKGEGEFTLHSRTYRLKRIGFWKSDLRFSELRFEDHTGERVVTLRASRFRIRRRGSIETGRAAGAENDLPFLVLLGLYIQCMNLKYGTASAAAG